MRHSADAHCRRRAQFARVTVKRRLGARRLRRRSETERAASRLTGSDQAGSGTAGIVGNSRRRLAGTKMSATRQLQLLR